MDMEKDNPEARFEAPKNPENSAERLEGLKREYDMRVKNSKLGAAEKENCLKWTQEGKDARGKPLTVEQLEEALAKFSAHEAHSLRAYEKYKKDVADLIKEGVLAPFTKDGKSRLEEELKWFTDLPFDDEGARCDKKRARQII